MYERGKEFDEVKQASAWGVALLVLLVSWVAFFSTSVGAAARTYCVAASSCSGMVMSTLPEAAAAANALPGRDRIEIGPGRVPFAGTATITEPVDIVGAGRDRTVLVTGPGSGGRSTEVLNISSYSTVSDLSIHMTPMAGAVRMAAGITMIGTIERVSVTSEPAGTYEAMGVLVREGSTARNISVTLPSSTRAATAAVGVESGIVPATTTLEDVEASAYVGIMNISSGTVNATRVRVRGKRAGIYHVRGNLNLFNSLIEADGSLDYTGLAVTSGMLGEANLTVTHTTIIGPGTSPTNRSGGITVSIFGGLDSTSYIYNTVISGFDISIGRVTNSAGRAEVRLDNSLFDPSRLHSLNQFGGTGAITNGFDNLNADPRFVDAPARDYRLRYDSPLIDAGAIFGLLRGESDIDLNGAARIVDGNGRGAAVSDIGSFEYRRLDPVASFNASTTTVPAGRRVEFDGSASSDGDAGDILSYEWSFGDGSTASGVRASHSFNSAGEHRVTLRVTDPTGLSSAATGSVRVTGLGSLRLRFRKGARKLLLKRGIVRANLTVDSTGTVDLAAAAKISGRKGRSKGRSRSLTLARRSIEARSGQANPVSIRLSKSQVRQLRRLRKRGRTVLVISGRASSSSSGSWQSASLRL